MRRRRRPSPIELSPQAEAVARQARMAFIRRPIVVVPAEVAALWWHRFGMAEAEVTAREQGAPLSDDERRCLSDFAAAAIEMRREGSGDGTAEVPSVAAERSEPPVFLTAKQAALRSGVSQRAITKRCEKGTLAGARKVNDRWQIPQEAIDSEYGNR